MTRPTCFCLSRLALVALAATTFPAQAAALVDALTEAPGRHWLVLSGMSHHFQPERRDWREDNPGAGIEKEFTGTPWVATAGYFRNSYDRRRMLYEIARPVLFSLDAETAHETALAGLNVAGRLLPAGKPLPARPVEVMGLDFPNRIGLAAGLDKNGEPSTGWPAGLRLHRNRHDHPSAAARQSQATHVPAAAGRRPSSTAWASTITASMR
jgi:hypothetical protein